MHITAVISEGARRVRYNLVVHIDRSLGMFRVRWIRSLAISLVLLAVSQQLPLHRWPANLDAAAATSLDSRPIFWMHPGTKAVLPVLANLHLQSHSKSGPRLLRYRAVKRVGAFLSCSVIPVVNPRCAIT
jgi:hypothetical protein